MPTVAIIEGAEIIFYHNEHQPPHFHVKFAEHHAVIDIETMTVVEGFLPVAKRRMIVKWAALRRGSLLEVFRRAIAQERVERIE